MKELNCSLTLCYTNLYRVTIDSSNICGNIITLHLLLPLAGVYDLIASALRLCVALHIDRDARCDRNYRDEGGMKSILDKYQRYFANRGLHVRRNRKKQIGETTDACS